MQKKYFTIIALIAVLLVFGCTSQQNDTNSIMTDSNADHNFNSVVNNLDTFKVVKSGDTVSVDYTGRFTDGTIFDSSKGKSPLEFTVDEPGIIKGFNDAVKGMKIGETKTVTLAPADAYGPEDPAKIVVFDKNQFADFNTIKVGITVTAGQLQGIVTAKTDTNATINFNDKMAGKTLIFDITVVAIN